jgi:cytochrome c oxidase subunit 7c
MEAPDDRILSLTTLDAPEHAQFTVFRRQLLHLLSTMFARTAFRASASPTLVARRGFQSTRAQLASPYHYPEGPRSNLPFDPLKKGFAFKFWGFLGKLGAPSMAGSS